MTSFCYLHGTACPQNCARSQPRKTGEKWFNPQINIQWLNTKLRGVEIQYWWCLWR